MSPPSPELSIIIPTLNERQSAPALLANLARQEGVSFEVVLCDGGSGDGTTAAVAALAGDLPYPLALVSAPPGRPGQLNAGAAAAAGKFLLFLHADSLFCEPTALRQGLDLLYAAVAAASHHRLAGHFALRFRRTSEQPDPGYYFYECKARLDRPECSHGDQGLLLERHFFTEAGPFSDTYPMLAETRLADRIRAMGQLRLLPAELLTSARRFENEGLKERQVLNAMLMSCAAINWDPFFRELPHLYRSQDKTGRLQLAPIADRIQELLDQLPPGERREFWRATGGYVRDNAWQLAFALDVRRNFRLGLPPGSGPTPWLKFFDLCLGRLLQNSFGTLLGALVTRCWFALLRRTTPR